MSKESFEYRENIELELERLRELHERRQLLQQHWSELFEKIQALDFKYPSSVQFDEQRRFKSDRSFYTPEDREEYQVLEEGIRSVEAERDELDKEILKQRFELGVKYLTELNRREDVVWKPGARHEPDPSNPMDILYTEEWRYTAGGIDARLEITGERKTSFIEGVRQVAREIGDSEVTQALTKWPKERDVRFNSLSLAFSIGPKSLFRSNEELRPGFVLKKRLDPYNEAMDHLDVELPLSHNAYAFPVIEAEKQEQAKQEMVKLVRKLGIEHL